MEKFVEPLEEFVVEAKAELKLWGGQKVSDYIERYWRDATPQDAIKDPPMVARFGNGKEWQHDAKLSGMRRDSKGTRIWYAFGGVMWTHCQVYDAPDPGEGWRLVDPSKESPQDGDEVWSRGEGIWKPRLCPARDFTSVDSYRRRITPTVTYVPFTWEDREQLRGRWVYRDKQELQLVNFDNSDGFFANGVHVVNLCLYWKFIDTGKPVGKEVTQ